MTTTQTGQADRPPLDPERAERRRAVARTVQDLRDRLGTTMPGHSAFQHDLAAGYARNRLGTALAMPLLALLITATATLWVEPGPAIAWFTCVLVVHAGLVLQCRRFLVVPAGTARAQPWTTRFAIAELLNGLAWCGAPALAGFAEPGEGVAIFQFSATIIVISVGAMVAATIPFAAVLGTLPIVLTAGFVFLRDGTPIGYAVATLVLCAEVFFLILAGRFHRAMLATLESKAEKDLLIGELETARAVSDEARRRAEDANLAKSRFLATMSHELRTPLNAILGFSEVMKGEVLGPMPNPTYRAYAADIHSSGEHLLGLISEILDLSRVEAGRYTLHEEAVSLARLVEECRHLVQLKAASRNLVLVEAIEPDLPQLWADARALRQIVLNLLSNAVKFTRPGGRVEVRVGWTAGGGQYVSISDNGPGIPEDEIPIVLSAFGQGSATYRSAEEGAGLGLPIVQALMRTHGGSFDLGSRVGEGTVATAIFPRSRVMEAVPPVDDAGGTRWRRTG